MRVHVAIGSLLLSGFLSLTSFAQSVSDQLIPASQRSHNFGTVARAANTEHQFLIRNPFNQPLHLRSIRTSCGCTTPLIETETIAPGETGSVLARFNTGTFTGDRKATITVTIDQPQFMELQLNVRGYIRSDVVFNPGEMSLGSVPRGEPRSAEATLDYAGKSDWQIQRITSDSRFLSAKFEEVSRGSGRVRYLITATLDPACPAGPLATQLILHTNDQRLTTVPLRAFADVQADLSASPGQLALGDIQPGETVTQRILLKGHAPFTVQRISGSNVIVEYAPLTEARSIQFIQVTLAANAAADEGEHRASLNIVTDLEGGKSVQVDLSYRLRKQISDDSAGDTPPGVLTRSQSLIVPARVDPAFEF
jgi:hypothetical protein